MYTTQYSDIHGYNTIHKFNLYVQLCNTDQCKKNIINMGIKIFNNLPLELKSIENFKDFKGKLKSYLLHSTFYSFQEFLTKSFFLFVWWEFGYCGPLYKPWMIGDGNCGEIDGMKIGRGNQSTWRKPAPAPLCPPQIPHDYTRV
jgi:hypothetical protein